MKEKLTKTGVLPLDIPFCALLAWKLCFIRFFFYTGERTGLGGWENIVFIVFCAGYSLGVLTSGFIGLRIEANERKSRILFCLAVAAAILCTVLSANTRMTVSMLFTFLAAFLAAFATGRCLHRLAMSLRRSRLGLFFGISCAISEALMWLLFLQPFYRPPIDGATAALCLLLAAAGLAFRFGCAGEEPEEEAPDPPPQRKTMLKFAIILFIYCGVAGMLDNLYAFDGIFGALPYFMQYIYLYSIGINLLAGFILDRTNWRKAVLAAIMLICAGQSLSFFSSIEALAIPYIALTTLGMVAMEVYLVALPVYYARDTKRPGLVCCLGCFAQYLGYGSTSVLFEFIPKGRYLFVLGIVLVVVLAILSLLYTASGEEEREWRNLLMKRLQDLSEARTAAEEADQLLDDFFRRFETLTPTEREVFRHLANGRTNNDIRDLMYISVSTVKKHNTHIFTKLSVSSRDDLALYVSLARKSGKFELVTK